MKNKSVTIVGNIKNHYRFYLSISEIFIDYTVTLCCTNEVFNLIKEIENSSHIILKLYPKDKLYNSFIEGDINIIEQPYLLKQLIQLAFRKKISNYFLVCHNINTWFFPLSNIDSSFKVKNIRSMFLREIIKYRLKKIIVVSDKLVNSIQNKKRNVICIPFDILLSSENIKNKTSVSKLKKIVIPGTISRARDYELIMCLIISLENLKDKFEFIFLGKPSDEYGNDVLSKLNNLKLLGYKIKTFSKFISAFDYHYELKSCDIILSAFDNKFVTGEGFVEYYGISKETGVPYLGLTYNKIIILPETYNHPTIVSDQVLTFKDINSLNPLLDNLYNSNLNSKPILGFNEKLILLNKLKFKIFNYLNEK